MVEKDIRHMAVNDADQAEIFNKFFISVMSQPSEAPKIAEFHRHTRNYLTFSEHEKALTLVSLDIKKACGPDDIGNIILKHGSVPNMDKSSMLLLKGLSQAPPSTTDYPEITHPQKGCLLNELQTYLTVLRTFLPLPPASLCSSWILHCLPLSSSLAMNQLLPVQIRFHQSFLRKLQ